MAQKRRRIHDIDRFHKEAMRRGLTYAEAQIEETCEKIGPVRAPEEENPEHPVYQKVSTRRMLKNIKGN
ncbi:MAG: hypothetical protein NC416_04415 [Eubacterium sp.]|nr:hypothetical protein [Eubacterium sp.]